MASGAPFYKTLLLQIEADLFFSIFFKFNFKSLSGAFSQSLKFFYKQKSTLDVLLSMQLNLKKKSQ